MGHHLHCLKTKIGTLAEEINDIFRRGESEFAVRKIPGRKAVRPMGEGGWQSLITAACDWLREGTIFQAFSLFVQPCGSTDKFLRSDACNPSVITAGQQPCCRACLRPTDCTEKYTLNGATRSATPLGNLGGDRSRVA